MNKAKVLAKAFEIAEKNGYKINKIVPMDKIIEYGIYYKFIFNHDFAKAFFLQRFTGGKMVINQNYYLDCLAEMAREKDPILYIKRFLEGGDKK